MAQQPASSYQQRVQLQADEAVPVSSNAPPANQSSSIPEEVTSASSASTSQAPTPNSLATSKPPASSKPVSSAARRGTGQPTVAGLARLGIKVRDFGYENPLPPVVGFRRQQIQPDPATYFKRHREDENDQSSESSQDQGGAKKAKMERTVTEPFIEDSSSQTQTMGRRYENLNTYDLHGRLEALNSQPNGPSPSSSSQPPPPLVESQGSEPYVNTPLVTPNGSLQWKGVDDMPALQLDSESQAVAPEVVSYSQLGFSQVDEPSQREVTPTPSSPLTEPPSSLIFPPRAASPAPAAGPSARRRADPTTPSVISHTSSFSHAVTPPITTSRYQLRERRAVSSTHESPAATTSRARAVHSHALPRSPAFSKQSMHSQRKSSGGVSPSTRVLRKRTVSGARDKRVLT